MDKQQTPAGINIGHMKKSKITNILSINNAGGALRVGKMENSEVSDITNLNNVNSQDFNYLIKTVYQTNNTRTIAVLDSLVKKPHDLSAWKTLIDRIGKPAAKVAVEVLKDVGVEEIKQYIRSKGIFI